MKTLYRSYFDDIEELEYQLHENPDTFGIAMDTTFADNEFRFSIDKMRDVSFEDIFKSVKSTDKQLLLNNVLLLPNIEKEFLQYLRTILPRFPNLVICNSNLEALRQIKSQLPEIKTAVDFYNKLYQDQIHKEPKDVRSYGIHNHDGFGTDFELHSHPFEQLIVSRVNQGRKVVMDWPEYSEDIYGSDFNVLLNVKTTDNMEIVTHKEAIKTFSSFNR